MLVLSGSQATAQRWLSQLRRIQRGQPRIDYLIQSLETYYRERPVNLGLDKLRPTFRFVGEREGTERFPAASGRLHRPAASASRRLVGCDAEDQAVPRFDRGTGRKYMRAFRAALSRRNRNAVGQDAVGIWPIGKRDDIGNGKRPLGDRVSLAVDENGCEVVADGRIITEIC